MEKLKRQAAVFAVGNEAHASVEKWAPVTETTPDAGVR
jgi:hypothetical protein